MKIVQIDVRHKPGVMRIINHYIENSFAAYAEIPRPDSFFDLIIDANNAIAAFAMENESGDVIGFCKLKPFHPGDAIKRTAELTYFIDPQYTHKGIGSRILDELTEVAKKNGVDNLIANVSSKNEPSIRFHEKHGFLRVGCLRNSGRKFGEDFDLLLFQKKIG